MQCSQKIKADGFVRLTHILKIFPISRSTWWAGVKTGKYPKPIKLSSNITAWRIEDINDLIADIEKPNKTSGASQ